MRTNAFLFFVMILSAFLNGCKTIDNLIERDAWAKYGLAEKRQEWKDAGFKTPEEAASWNRYRDFHDKPELAGSWKNAGFSNPKATFSWSSVYFSAEDAKKWLDAGFKAREQCPTCEEGEYQLGYSTGDILYADNWKYVGITNPVDAQMWIDSGIDNTSSFRGRWGITIWTKAEAQDWIDAGFKNIIEINHWIESGLKNANEANQWKEAGYDYGTFSSLSTTLHYSGIKLDLTPSLAKDWKSAGLSIEKALPWMKVGITSAKAIKEWQHYSLTPKDAAWFKQSNISNPKTAKSWINSGVNPPMVKSSIKAGFTPSTLKNACGSIVEFHEYLSQSPYKYKNKCVSVCVEVAAVRSKNNVEGYVAPKRSRNRPVSVTATTRYSNDFTNGNTVCGIFKITGVKKFLNLLGRSLTGNTLKRLSNTDFISLREGVFYNQN